MATSPPTSRRRHPRPARRRASVPDASPTSLSVRKSSRGGSPPHSPPATAGSSIRKRRSRRHSSLCQARFLASMMMTSWALSQVSRPVVMADGVCDAAMYELAIDKITGGSCGFFHVDFQDDNSLDKVVAMNQSASQICKSCIFSEQHGLKMLVLTLLTETYLTRFDIHSRCNSTVQDGISKCFRVDQVVIANILLAVRI